MISLMELRYKCQALSILDSGYIRSNIGLFLMQARVT